MLDSANHVEVVVRAGARLGEGPVWDTRSGRLVWVDVLASRVYLTDIDTGASDEIETPLHAGAVAPRAAGGFVAALQDGFWVIGMGPPELITRVPEARPDLRFNDGKCDPAGRFWAGTMAYDGARGAGALYRLGADGLAERILDGVTISNGLAWSADGLTMYYVDSATQQIDTFSFAPSTGEISDRRCLVQIPSEMGAPDGMTIDADGGLWVALWGGSAVHRYVDGRLDRVVQLPISMPTSCTFGGAELDELYITSMSEGLSDEQRAAQPLAGAIFRLRPGVRGVPPAIFAGA
ncbi:MAG: SMP-30/gluconolactonase/LRE family protein [Chloroflexi bacterium]|nr:MAG: SMP-30/gluconolactonase/LRE family protein [Chloroflexota bacterium]